MDAIVVVVIHRKDKYDGEFDTYSKFHNDIHFMCVDGKKRR